ncbi:hypothetical protein [Jeotgalibacillus aurantiacus]|uniref:hypothetical protein n=1 Tax=Jeotgalibacillus aurantiacus TaxID=2763266 RepID=UPI001D0BBDD1|nr:hypothetical protein [Jeotgalibacillus aurantiacus]
MFYKLIVTAGLALLLASCMPESQAAEPFNPKDHHNRLIPFSALEKQGVPKNLLYPIEEYTDETTAEVPAKVVFNDLESYVSVPFYMGGTVELTTTYKGVGEGSEGVSFAIDVTEHESGRTSTFYLDRQKYKEFYEELKKKRADVYLTGYFPPERRTGDVSATGFITDLKVLKYTKDRDFEPSEELQMFMDEKGASTSARDVKYDPFAYDGRYFALEGQGQLLQHLDGSEADHLMKTHFKMRVSSWSSDYTDHWTLYFDREKFADLYKDALDGFVRMKAIGLYEDDITSRYDLQKAIVRDVEYDVVKPAFTPVSEQGTDFMKQHNITLEGKDIFYEVFNHLDKPFFVEGSAELVDVFPGNEKLNGLEGQYVPIRLKYDPFVNQYVDLIYQVEHWTLLLDREKHSELIQRLQKNPTNIRTINVIPSELYTEGDRPVGVVQEVEW